MKNIKIGFNGNVYVDSKKIVGVTRHEFGCRKEVPVDILSYATSKNKTSHFNVMCSFDIIETKDELNAWLSSPKCGSIIHTKYYLCHDEFSSFIVEKDGTISLLNITQNMGQYLSCVFSRNDGFGSCKFNDIFVNRELFDSLGLDIWPVS